MGCGALLRSAPGQPLRRLARASDGSAITEFGLIAPVLFLLLFGMLDVGHTQYMKSVLEGAVQKAARDTTLESSSGTDSAARDAIDQAVKNQISPLHGTATVTFTRRFYKTFTDAAAAYREDFNDGNGNGRCDNNETYTDENNNEVWDADGGDSINRAGARDNVVYTATVSYPRMFPLHGFINVPANTTVTASTVLSNQPYGDQTAYDAPTNRTCTT